MPALRMKTKPILGVRDGHHSLHACHKPAKALKNSCFCGKTSQLAGMLDTFCDSMNVNAVASNIELSGKHPEAADAVDSCKESSNQDPDFPVGSTDIASIGKLGAQSTPVLETIFSPVLEHGEAEGKSSTDRDADVDQADLPLLISDDSDDGNSSPSDYESCDVSDYYYDLSPMSFDGGVGFLNIVNSSSPDYDLISSELTFDIEERYMILPSPEIKLETTSIHDSCEEALVSMDKSYLYPAIHQLNRCEQETENSGQAVEGEEIDSLDPQLFNGNFFDVSERVSPLTPTLLPKESRKRKSVTLVLDLDETLVHSTLELCDNADFTFLVFFDMKEHPVHVKRRPFLHLFLERVAQMFKIVVFTASQSIYAAQLLDMLDPDKKLISQRIYHESCVFSGGSYIKDLTILGVDLARVAIIDNSPQVYQLQVNNGIPIKSWFDDPTDSALISLLPFLETLVDADDVRALIAKKFNNKELQ